MKKAISLFVLLIVTSTSFAKSGVMAVVSDLKGQAFYSAGGKTMPLKKGMHLSSQTEVFTEVGAQVSINDYYDHIYHLSGAGHIVIHRNLVELKEGYLWVKSLAFDELKGPMRVNTPNAIAENKVGEGIISFDSYSGKSQILTVKGDFSFRNSLNEFQNAYLTEGQFSFIQNDHEEGSPRKPTPIGYASYQKVTSLFSGVESANKKAMNNQRTYPSNTSPEQRTTFAQAQAKSDPFAKVLGDMPQKKAENNQYGQTTVIKLRKPASVKSSASSLMNYYNSKVKKLAAPKPAKKWKRTYKQKKSSVPVRIYGAGHSTTYKKVIKPSSARYPASVPSAPKTYTTRTPASVGGMLPEVKASPFESALGRQYKKQMRHDQEVNDLIDQLKSVDMDYKKDY